MTSGCKPFDEEGDHVIEAGQSGASCSVSNNNEGVQKWFMNN